MAYSNTNAGFNKYQSNKFWFVYLIVFIHIVFYFMKFYIKQ
jgi:hypothetical protein